MAELLKLVAPLARQLWGPYPGGRLPARSRVRSSESPPIESGSEPERPLACSVRDVTRLSLHVTPYQLQTDTSFSQFFFDFQPAIFAELARSTKALQSATLSVFAHGSLYRAAAVVQVPLSRAESTRVVSLIMASPGSGRAGSLAPPPPGGDDRRTTAAGRRLPRYRRARAVYP